MSSPTRQSRQRRRPGSQANARPPVSDPARDQDELPAIPVLEDETYHLMAGPGLEESLMKLHESLSNLVSPGLPAASQDVEVSASAEQAVAMAPAAALAPEVSVCSACAEEIRALGLPYRIVLRCTHD